MLTYVWFRVSRLLSGTQKTSVYRLQHHADLGDLFSEDSLLLPDHGPFEPAIELQEGKNPPYIPLYNLSSVELATLREYLRKYLERGWIHHSKLLAEAPMLFSRMMDGGLRLCVDYRRLSSITIQN